MYIKSMVIDGFKSYAQRTEINGFDPLFNAITGLNGSGKSNILDAICFLLGISNLSQVRATNLQELVYKNGQAGVSKATVSITFDNRDKKQTPLGYEQYDEITVTRQVVIGGRNKYLINGSNANNTRVQDLFRSVQLNVNNPHFLIMQGRITKVLNMKPPEILSMIEEAAGTRLYESKKESAQKTIEKKDAKLREIDTILKEEITPTLSKLKEERSSYLEYQKVIRELEHLNKLYVAWQFVCAEESRVKCSKDLIEIQETINDLKERRIEVEGKMKELDAVIVALTKKRDEEAGGVMQKLEEALHEKQKEEAKAKSALTNKNDTLKAENKKLNQLNKQLSNDEASLKGKDKDLAKIDDDFKRLQNQSQQDTETYAAAQKHFHAVSAGLSSNQDGDDASLNEQLLDAKKEISNCETQSKQADMKLKHAQQELKKKQNELKKSEGSYKKDKDNHENLKKSVNKLKGELDKLGYEEGKEENLEERRRKLAQEVRNLQEQVDTLNARFPQLQFEYRDPEKNFDRSKVYGPVATLIQIKDVKTATALEVSAGGKLYNIVVDTEQTGKKLLTNGQLKRRVTIIPLNKVAGRSIEAEKIRRAEQLVGKNNVRTALSLVGYENELDSAMKFVFGDSFVCPNMDHAKRVTYEQGIMKKSVTYDGDSFNPGGTLTGGARKKSGSILSKLNEVNEAQTVLRHKQQELQGIENELAGLQRTVQRYRQLKQQFDLKSHEAELLEDRLKQSTHHQQLAEIEELEQSIKDAQTTAIECEDRKKTANKKVKDLQDKLKDAKATRERELKAAEAEVKKAKDKMDKSSKQMKAQEQEVESIKLEKEELFKDIEQCREQIATVEETIKGFESQVSELREAAENKKAEVKEAQQELNKQKDLLKECNKDITEKTREHKDLSKELSDTDLKMTEYEHKLTKCNKEAKDADRTVDHMLQTYDWIADEKKYFGQQNTAYDFKANDPKEAWKRMQKLTETKEKLSKNVNMRAMNMLTKAEEQYNDLIKKRKIVLNDKAKIAAVIAELDEKKNEALKKAHGQVNQDFGSIFSTLLPGTQAKLVAPDGQSILDGLEVKVAFGDVWKESLTELSGGQRSLVALSLVLSLLLFKPAPLYILDEVDAALDLSHTQNIGQMLRTHFTHSQVIPSNLDFCPHAHTPFRNISCLTLSSCLHFSKSYLKNLWAKSGYIAPPKKTTYGPHFYRPQGKFIVVSLKDGMFNNANVLFRTKFVDGVSTVARYAQSTAGRSAVPAAGLNKTKQVARKEDKGAKRPRMAAGENFE